MDNRQSETRSPENSSPFSSKDVNLGVPFNTLQTQARNVDDYTLIDNQGRIWTNASDHKRVEQMLQQATKAFSREPVTG